MRKMSCEKMRKWLCVFAFIAFVVGMSSLTMAEQTMQDTQSQEQKETISYTIIKEKQALGILWHDKRYLFTGLEEGTTLSSDNPKVVQVAQNGLTYGKKVGKAHVTVTQGNVKRIYTVEVKDTVDIILFAGQSNMYGTGGNYSLAPKVSLGQAYEYDIETNAKTLLPMQEPFGRGEKKCNWYNTNQAGYSNQGTLASAFCINYYKQTKTPVVGVFAAGGGISSEKWLTGSYMKDSVSRLKKAKTFLKKKKIKVRHIYVVWYQGETDAMLLVDQATYIRNMKSIYQKYKKAGVEHMMIIRIGHHKYDGNVMRGIQDAQVKLCKNDKHFTMVSKLAATLRLSNRNYYADALHMNQYGLNKIGYDAGTKAGKYAKKHSSKK